MLRVWSYLQSALRRWALFAGKPSLTPHLSVAAMLLSLELTQATLLQSDE
jgi:hypothetical protein